MEPVPISVYLFKLRVTGSKQESVVCAATAEVVEIVFGGGGLFGEAGVETVFGGVIGFKNSESNERYFGVWGRRKAAMFRRRIRERFPVEIVGTIPDASVQFRSKINGAKAISVSM
jgi:hypothetical protein